MTTPCAIQEPHCLKKAVSFLCPDCGRHTCDQCKVRYSRDGKRTYACMPCAREAGWKKQGQKKPTVLPMGALQRFRQRVLEQERRRRV